ncbi:HpcH/HpaI aldolase family protein [Natronobacterium texcoconense]|uniref:4-hydroxy-2-oxoheptanedioate aldolase n=1 Tax=Natronobacterium texcoconense TaxID=1095778 RepID=A0A1H1IEW6_NATTX|nr:aldolase/citrate lyase family protein [Natronobacterium texcoconense]SDR35846.1 4-hydroxy-2-oxoheptanedioate aldolase [Natronobacterium texcoconense]
MTLASKLRDRDPVVGNWLTLADPAVTEASAQLEFDVAVIDREHTPISLETTTEMARAVDATRTDTETLVRVSENDATEIKRVLDAGVAGVMGPMIETAAEAQELVAATRYPPEGVRGVGIGRATGYGDSLADSVENADPVTIAQIETRDGLANVEEIAAVDGLDGLFVGPADLSAALGIFGETDSEDFLEAVDRILEAGHTVDKPVATIALEEADVERWLERGFDAVMVGVDVDYVLSGSKRAKRAFEEAVGEQDVE